MKRTLTTIQLLTFSLVFTFIGYSQDVATDNDGKPIFVIPSTKKILPEVALNNLGFNYTIVHLSRTRYYVKPAANEINTMYKSNTLSFKSNLITNDEDILLLGKGMKVRPHFEIGFNRGFDELLKPSFISNYYTFSISVFTDYQQYNLYDSVNKKDLPKYKGWGFGGKVSYNLFFKTKSALALNFSIGNSVLTDDLTSFQRRSSNEIYADNNILTNGSNDGYFSPLSKTTNARFALAYPNFLKKSKVAIVPYYILKVGEGIVPKNNAGIMFTILNDKFRDFDLPAGPTNYKFETAFSIGLNFISTGSETKNYVFLSGTVSFGSAKAKKQKDAKEPQE